MTDQIPVHGTSKADGSFYCSSNANQCTKALLLRCNPKTCCLRLGFIRLGGTLRFAIRIHVRFHNLVKIRLVDHRASLGTFGFLLEIFAQKVEVEFAFFDLGASL